MVIKLKGQTRKKALH